MLNLRRLLVAAMASAACLVALPCLAFGTLTTTSSTGPALGEVADGASGAGTTTFTVSSAGAVSQSGGGDIRILSSAAVNTLLFTCSGNAACNSYVIKIVSTGAPVGRMLAVTNFTVAAGTTTPSAITGSGTATLTFTISVAKAGTGTVQLGMNVPIPDSSSAAVTGNASSSFSVTSVTANFVAGSGAATATVLRAIALAKATDLAFGTIVKPALAAGNGTVSVNNATGVRTATGTIALAPTPAATRAAYTVSGEGGTAFTITVPASVNMLSGGNSLTVTLTPTATGAQTLSNATGSGGTFNLGVGGSFPVTNLTNSGAYSATFPVTVVYN